MEKCITFSAHNPEEECVTFESYVPDDDCIAFSVFVPEKDDPLDEEDEKDPEPVIEIDFADKIYAVQNVGNDIMFLVVLNNTTVSIVKAQMLKNGNAGIGYLEGLLFLESRATTLREVDVKKGCYLSTYDVNDESEFLILNLKSGYRTYFVDANTLLVTYHPPHLCYFIDKDIAGKIFNARFAITDGIWNGNKATESGNHAQKYKILDCDAPGWEVITYISEEGKACKYLVCDSIQDSSNSVLVEDKNGNQFWTTVFFSRKLFDFAGKLKGLDKRGNTLVSDVNQTVVSVIPGDDNGCRVSAKWPYLTRVFFKKEDALILNDDATMKYGLKTGEDTGAPFTFRDSMMSLNVYTMDVLYTDTLFKHEPGKIISVIFSGVFIGIVEHTSGGFFIKNIFTNEGFTELTEDEATDYTFFGRAYLYVKGDGNLYQKKLNTN